MKIITLNTWGGRAGKEKLLGFFKQFDGKVDVFCLQEIWSAPYEHLEGAPAGSATLSHEEIMVQGLQDISEVLSDYAVYFHPHHLDHYGLMTLVKKDIEVLEDGDVFVYKHKGYIPEGNLGNHARNIQYVTIKTESGLLTIINFHGLWNGKGKTDSEERLAQSDNIVRFVEKLENPFVICGDFNLLPETESLKKFEQAGLQNLIKDYGITSTRTRYYSRPERFADYVFASKDLSITDFRVLPDEVSDHAALFIEVSVRGRTSNI